MREYGRVEFCHSLCGDKKGVFGSCGGLIREKGRYVELNEGDRILRKRSIEYLKSKSNDPEYQKWNMPNFIKLNGEEIDAIADTLDIYEQALLFRLTPYVGYEDCCLKHRNGKPLSVAAIQKISRN